MQTVGPGVWTEYWKSWKMRNTNSRPSNMVRNTENGGKWEMHIVWLRLWRENRKLWKRDKNTFWPGIWQETLKKMENKKCTT